MFVVQIFSDDLDTRLFGPFESVERAQEFGASIDRVGTCLGCELWWREYPLLGTDLGAIVAVAAQGGGET